MEHRDFIKLSKRLLMSASMVTKGNVVADVGCDHAHTDIYLVKENIAPRAIAMDVGEGPLSHANANIRLFGLTGRIETRLSDGLEKLEVGDADTLIIAGMGGTLTKIILEKKPQVVKSLKELILQPQSDPALVRGALRSMGFEIVCEDMCIEEGKFYNTMKAVPASMCADGAVHALQYDEDVDQMHGAVHALQHDEDVDQMHGGCDAQHDEDRMQIDKVGVRQQEVEDDMQPGDRELQQEMYDIFGRYLLERKHPVLKELLLNLKEKNLRVLEKIEKSGGDGSFEKKLFFRREKKIIEKALEYYG